MAKRPNIKVGDWVRFDGRVTRVSDDGEDVTKVIPAICKRCDNIGWVCEEHDRGGHGMAGLTLAAAVGPECPDCNETC